MLGEIGKTNRVPRRANVVTNWRMEGSRPGTEAFLLLCTKDATWSQWATLIRPIAKRLAATGLTQCAAHPFRPANPLTWHTWKSLRGLVVCVCRGEAIPTGFERTESNTGSNRPRSSHLRPQRGTSRIGRFPAWQRGKLKQKRPTEDGQALRDGGRGRN